MKLVKLNKNSLKEIGFEETYDLEINDKNHNFILENRIVTSNSHSYFYSAIAMQEIWLRMYYPEEFYAIALTSNDDNAKYGQYIIEAMKRGIQILPPDILKSKYEFYPTGLKEVSCGLKVLKGFGDAAYNELLKSSRQWKTIQDFLLEKWSKFNKRGLEAAIKCGAFKSLEPNTKLCLELCQYHSENKANLDKIHGRGEHKGQVKYSVEMLNERYEQLKELPDYTLREMDKMWSETTDFSYPFRNKFKEYLNSFSQYGVVPATSWSDQYPLVYGEVENIDEKLTTGKKPFKRITINDGFGSITFKCWQNQWLDNPQLQNLGIGELICVELYKQQMWGYTMMNNGRFLILT